MSCLLSPLRTVFIITSTWVHVHTGVQWTSCTSQFSPTTCGSPRTEPEVIGLGSKHLQLRKHLTSQPLPHLFFLISDGIPTHRHLSQLKDNAFLTSDIPFSIPFYYSVSQGLLVMVISNFLSPNSSSNLSNFIFLAPCLGTAGGKHSSGME